MRYIIKKMKIPTFLAMMVLNVFICRTDTADVEGDVRLVDGANAYEGRVEVFSGGRWGTVCDRWFDSADGQVVCHQLGYGSVAFSWKPVSIMHGAYFGGNAEIPINLADARCVGVEDRLTMCDGSWGDDVVDCDHSLDVGLICSYGNETEGDIRLIGAGVGIESEGRIQIVRHNAWGTICHHSWNIQDANVVCHQLGFEFATLATRNSYYGGGNLDQAVMLSNVRCNGTEEHLLDCENDGWGVGDCGNIHLDDAGVKCANEIFEGTMRLTNGASENEGLLGIYHGGNWGTICNDESFSDVEALVACRHLGYDTVTSFATSVTSGMGVIQLDAVSCYGYELTLGNCAHGEWGNPSSSCSHDTDVWLSCENKAAEQGAVRLVDGFTSSQGRVEYYDDGQWSTLCDTVGDLKKATVVCRQLGYLAASEAFGGSYFGSGSSDQPIDVVSCHGYEAAFEDCDHSVFGPEICQYHDNDAGVICTDQAYEGDLRLVNGSDYTEGRLEIFHDDQWGSICDNNWFGDDATVACRQMGLGNVKYAYQDYGPGQGPVHLDDVECHGTETNITTCQKGDWGANDCGHDSDVGMSCFLFEEPGDGDVRLTGGTSYTNGRVEVYNDYNDAWYSVCRDTSWGQMDARVICNVRELELESQDEDFGPSLYPGIISNVDCIGTESSFKFCDYNFEAEECGPDDTVGVVCKDYSVAPSEGDIRLRDGQTFDEGRVEIYHDAVWGFICKNNWGMNEAKVACRQLGYDHVHQAIISTNYVSRPVHLDNVQCIGDEESLVDCEHDPWGDVNCVTTYGVGIACSETPVAEPLEGWAIALIVIFSVMVLGFGASTVGYFIYRKKPK
eukprot:XP_011679510.1 PREDICTED: deleted in malignant brain tumors 1 protein-like [Strongylocentrotus purpuratus]